MSRSNPTKRDLQAAETRKTIFDTAFQLITDKGFENVTVEEIAKQSGVAKGLFYHYFKSKDDIVIETYMIIDHSFSAFYEQNAPRCNAIERVYLANVFQARHATKLGVDFVRQIYKSQLYAGTAYFISKDRPFYTILLEAVRMAQAEGSIRRDVSADMLTKIMLNCGRGVIYDWCLHNGNFDLEQQMNLQFSLIIQGVHEPESDVSILVRPDFI